MDFPMRRLSENEKKWLKTKMKDDCPEVADTAREIYNVCFPYAERNAIKKQLVINTLSFGVHTEVYDEYGNMELVDRHFTIDRKSRVLTMTDFQTEGVEQSVTLEGGQMAKLLRYIVHTLEIFMWEEDYSTISECQVKLDEQIFYRIVENIFSNAIRYAKSKVNFGYSLTDGMLMITISDDGKGFSRAMLRKKNTFLYSEDKTGEHMGLRLATSRVLSQKHGGSLELSNIASGGACVTIKLAVHKMG
ncbi:Sensor protein CpxA [Acetatifactor muris]|uniref:histidine kinase n=3 Tax=Acetatifactor muris TaxID=879566 RepID=A0A2K4ZJ82_9FIRM|nr:Sensor protein CpxA [Acetatifactor muris]